MITNAIQLKAKIQNLSGGDSDKAMVFIRNYMMERFLERIAKSEYQSNFVLKGGMLVSSLVGINMRASMDIDTTVTAIPLTLDEATKIVEKIISIDIGDNVKFKITKAFSIMEEHDYPGLRFMLEGTLDNLRQAIKVDISTGDTITPRAINYRYKLLMEDRSIEIFTYNMETLLAEKIETIISRSTANTRMRDFYDLYILTKEDKGVNPETLQYAIDATCRSRDSLRLLPEANEILNEIVDSSTMKSQWDRYVQDSFYIENLQWDVVANYDREFILKHINQ